jgi:NADP-dependent aldehyde dehydrogenase
VLREKAGRLVWNGFPTGVAVSYAMHHGGPHPATSNPLHTSVGATSIRRFLRPVAWQDAPEAVLPPELHDADPGIPRRMDGVLIPSAARS